MNYRLAQIILAARSDDAEGWMNTLVVVLLVVFWAIGGILKARAKKTKIEDEDEYSEEPLKPTARPSTAKAVYKAHGTQVQRIEPQRSVAGIRKIEARQAKPSVTVRKGQGLETAVAKVTSEWAKKPVSAPEEPTIEPLLSAEEPDPSSAEALLRRAGELRRAILHYEILGKPLSLREPMDKGLR